MPQRAASTSGTLITSARKGRTLDLEERNKRYLITMAVRMAMLALIFVVPGWWKLAMLIGAAVLPVVAVVLANHYHEPQVPMEEPVEHRLALPGHHTVLGEVEEEL